MPTKAMRIAGDGAQQDDDCSAEFLIKGQQFFNAVFNKVLGLGDDGGNPRANWLARSPYLAPVSERPGGGVLRRQILRWPHPAQHQRSAG